MDGLRVLFPHSGHSDPPSYKWNTGRFSCGRFLGSGMFWGNYGVYLRGAWQEELLVGVTNRRTYTYLHCWKRTPPLVTPYESLLY